MCGLANRRCVLGCAKGSFQAGDGRQTFLLVSGPVDGTSLQFWCNQHLGI